MLNQQYYQGYCFNEAQKHSKGFDIETSYKNTWRLSHVGSEYPIDSLCSVRSRQQKLCEVGHVEGCHTASTVHTFTTNLREMKTLSHPIHMRGGYPTLSI